MSMGQNPQTDFLPALPLGYAPALRHESRWGKGFLSVCATMLFLGLGHWIAGARRRAIGWLVAALMLWTAILISLFSARLQPALFVLVPIQLLMLLSAYIDAFVIGRRSRHPMLGSPWRRYVAGIILLVLADLTHKALVSRVVLPRAEAFVTSSQAMAPTLVQGSRFLTVKSFDVRRWDIVVVHPPVNPKTAFLDRVVGMPGETVELIAGKVNINGVPLNPPEAWIRYQNALPSWGIGNGCQGNPITLGPDEYYLLGDNSPLAGDARYWNAGPGHQPGAVTREAIVAKATCVYWPPARWRRFP